MKAKHLLIAGTCVAFAISFSSCEKNDTAESPGTEIATTTDLANRQATSDNIAEDNNDIFMEASVSGNVTGNRPVAGRPLTPGPPNIMGGATVTVTPLVGFPKTITIDFGAGTTGPRGVVRSGKINIVVSDSVRKSGSTAVMTFENYFVNGFKVEGTYTWTNTSTVGIKSWKREVVNGKITNSSGIYWTHNGVKFVTQTEGSLTPFDLSDDVFSITGTHTIMNMLGRERTVTIVTPLIKATSCRYISQGSIKIQGPNHNVVIDFGAGTCDNLATISLDGLAATQIELH
ncbi:hypothetical protein LK994_06925 [Ferruginibacter lapsinanis]|uniref:hypothetical protein n=1 Tax=Ferruginibacter lapsinanis TaxID=563172 RepID=UPI001E49C957|nr:hypothetical protein [Ferruginibacter lapsinanis]UEG51206.1 hypothetical protein LK994_06925 [Ferruginibacter lapsinanis]